LKAFRNLLCNDLTIQRFTFFELPMAGLESARANYGPTDFKSVSHEQSALTAASRRFIEAYQGDS
jgi:hypothetical protein